MIIPVLIRAGEIQAQESRAMDSRVAYQDAVDTAQTILDTRRRDGLLKGIALGQARSGDFTAARKTAELIDAKTLQTETNQAIQRVETERRGRAATPTG